MARGLKHLQESLFLKQDQLFLFLRLFLVSFCAVIFFVLVIVGSTDTSSRSTHNSALLDSGFASRDETRLRVAIIFYGITRSLNITIMSIQENIFRVLVDHDVEYRTFLHHMIVEDVYTNLRTGENNLILNNSEWKLIKPDVELSTSQRAFTEENAEYISLVTSFGDAHRDGNVSTKYSVQALFSMREAVLAAYEEESFDGMLILRPDLLYHDPIDACLLRRAIMGNFVVTPGWQRYGGTNDRFSFGAWDPMMTVGTRFNAVRNYLLSVKQPFLTENFLGWLLDEHMSLSTLQSQTHCHTNQTASRVRATGLVKAENFQLDESYNPC